MPLRFRSGQVHLRKFRVDAETVIEPGTIVCLADDRVVPMSTQPNAAAVAVSVAGVAHQRSEAGQTAPVSVDVSPLAVYECDVASEIYEVGDLLGAAADPSADERLSLAASANEAIAMASEFSEGATTRLRITVASTLCTASSHALAQLG